MYMHQFAELIEKAAEIREQSYVRGDQNGLSFNHGYYTKTYDVAAQEAAELMKVDKAYGQIVGLLLFGTWNDALEWAKEHGIPKCTCTFRASGVSLDNTGCVVHTKATYPCDDPKCGCMDYRPHKAPTEQNKWPRCICGHIAQEHN